MKKTTEVENTENKKMQSDESTILKSKLSIAFASVIEALFLLLEIYFMMHAQGNFTVLVIIAICMVVVLFFLVLSAVDLSQKNKELERREYADIYKAQKASYLAQKKYFDEINERLDLLEQNTNFPTDDIISAQKAVAKVAISRNKENAEALMNANDELIQRVFGFEEKLADNNATLMQQQESMLRQTKEDLLENHKNMQDQFDLLHNALEQMQQEINALELKQATVISEPMMANPVMEEPMMEEPVIEEPVAEESVMEEPVIEEPMVEEPVMEEPVIEEPMAEEPMMEEPVIPEPVAEEPAVEPLDTDQISQADIDAMLASLANDTQEMSMETDAVGAEDLPDLEPIPDMEGMEDVAMPDLGMKEDLPDLEAMENLPDLETMEDLPDLDAVMEEPEALEESTITEEPAAPEEPATAEEAAPEKPPMPDLSDPNKVLSPDEIAALFANM